MGYKVLELVYEVIWVVGYKANIKNDLYFIIENLKEIFFKKMLIVVAFKKFKYLGINVVKVLKFHPEDYEKVLRAINE